MPRLRKWSVVHLRRVRPDALPARRSCGRTYQLRYGWTGWIAERPTSAVDFATLFGSLDPMWEADGLRRLEHHIVDGTWQITFSAKPNVSPVFLATRVKGRLQHVLRTQGNALQFSRKLAVRSIGDNTRADVGAYIARQVDKESFADVRFREAMRELTVEQRGVDLAEPTATDSGVCPWATATLGTKLLCRHIQRI